MTRAARISRLGITIENFQPELLDGIEGFHFHTLCEQNSDDLVPHWSRRLSRTSVSIWTA